MTQKTRNPGEKWITTMRLGSGWAAVMLWVNPSEDSEYGAPYPFVEPYHTGIGRYATEEEAEAEARSWAEAEELEYEPSQEKTPVQA